MHGLLGLALGDAHVIRDDIARVRAEPAIPHRDSVRDSVYDVSTGALREVVQA